VPSGCHGVRGLGGALRVGSCLGRRGSWRCCRSGPWSTTGGAPAGRCRRTAAGKSAAAHSRTRPRSGPVSSAIPSRAVCASASATLTTGRTAVPVASIAIGAAGPRARRLSSSTSLKRNGVPATWPRAHRKKASRSRRKSCRPGPRATSRSSRTPNHHASAGSSTTRSSSTQAPTPPVWWRPGPRSRTPAGGAARPGGLRGLRPRHCYNRCRFTRRNTVPVRYLNPPELLESPAFSHAVVSSNPRGPSTSAGRTVSTPPTRSLAAWSSRPPGPSTTSVSSWPAPVWG